MDEQELREALTKIKEYCKSRRVCEECIFGSLIGIKDHGLYIFCEVSDGLEEIID